MFTSVVSVVYIVQTFQKHIAERLRRYFRPTLCGIKFGIAAYGIGYAGQYEDGSFMPYCAPVLFFNDKNELICDMLTNTLSATKNGVTITVPEGATRMHLTNYNNQNFTIQKVLYLTDKEFDNLPINRTDLEKEINEKYAAYQEDKTVYRNSEKACITFVNDDTWGSIDEFSEMFIEKDIPLVLATLPELLIENASSQKETRLDVARRVEAAGGEIIAHNGGVLTQEGFSDYNTMYSFFVRTKQMFNYYGFDVNGIILAGGQGQVPGAAESERWATSFYSYSDLYGVPYDKVGIALDSAYYHYRTGLGNFKSDYDKIISKIDEAIEKKQWLVFYFHSYSEIDKDVLAKVLDYVNSKRKPSTSHTPHSPRARYRGNLSRRCRYFPPCWMNQPLTPPKTTISSVTRPPRKPSSIMESARDRPPKADATRAMMRKISGLPELRWYIP